MKLRVKLLLGVGCLLLAMIIILYIVPSFFIRKEMYTTAEEIQALLIESKKQLVVLRMNHHDWIGVDSSGHKLSQDRVDAIAQSEMAHQTSGTININHKPYAYNLITSVEKSDASELGQNGVLAFYALHPLGNDQSIIKSLLSLEDKLSNRISFQLLLISLAAMALILLFISRMSFLVINPITKLAAATKSIVAGRYGEVILPDIGNRKDEVATLTHSFANMVVGLQEREKIRGVLDKVVSKDVADEILKSHIQLGGEDRVVTVLFSDIRGFSQLSAALSPQKTIGMLNTCMTKISRVIEGEGGVIDKYIGDEVMAIYGAPTIHPDHALRAVSSGMLMIETLKAWNQERINAHEPSISMGIGIHTGVVVAGNMGSEDRLNYTVLGSNVNLAERLCEVAKPNQLIISAATLAQPHVANSFYVKSLGPFSFKGFSEVIEIYEVTGFKWEQG